MMATPKLGKGLGRRADAPDTRDLHVFALPHLGIEAPLPTAIDVFHGLSLPVYDQGSLGSCTANAGVLYRRFLAQRFSKYSAPDADLSRLFLYYQERKLPWNDATQADGGASIRDSVFVLAHTGVCPERDDPYETKDFSSSPLNDSARDLADANSYRIGAYHRIHDGTVARQVLASGYAVLLGFTVYASFEEIGRDGVMSLPQTGEQVLGGHAVVIRGYDDSRNCFQVQNSWGPGWGDQGCFWIPYSYLDRTEVSEPDMWMAHLGKPWRN